MSLSSKRNKTYEQSNKHQWVVPQQSQIDAMRDAAQELESWSVSVMTKINANISGLAENNIRLLDELTPSVQKQSELVRNQSSLLTNFIYGCLRVQDGLSCLQVLQKKTQILAKEAIELELVVFGSGETPK